ncbi:FMN-red domain-containing protein [Mycena chlorophos]|uniref:FMN-red domain-containing protein n=1 Tax=Mycena chlorophos TaxID=658473 RepID=A0A8H6S2E1_MYCCL|nr:FMN-red domain-containing protein [Mycena chlorophos]
MTFARMSRIAIILGSTRTPSIGPTVAGLITAAITPLLPTGATLTTLNLKDHPLPVYLTGAPPVLVTPGEYPNPQTNAWSKVIADLDAFIFCTPQHNWSIPATLKLALDAIFKEWSGKPVMVVTYGGRGGGLANEHLRQICKGMRMNVCERSVELVFGQGHSPASGEVEPELMERWTAEDKKTELVRACEALVAMLKTNEE